MACLVWNPSCFKLLLSSNSSLSSDDTDARRSGATQTSWPDIAWLVGLSGVLFLILLSSSSYVASLPFIRTEWGLNNTQSGVIFSSYLAGYAVSSLLLVPFTDRFNPLGILIIGVVLTACSGFLFPLLAEGLWTASLLRFIYGVGHVCVYITGIRLVSHRFAGGSRATAVSVFVGSGYAGTTVSYLFMGILLGRVAGWEPAFLVTTLPGLASIAIAAFLASGQLSRTPRVGDDRGDGDSHGNRDDRRNFDDGRNGNDHGNGNVQGIDAERRNDCGTVNGGWLSLAPLRDRRLVLVIMAYALHTAELFLARLWLPLLLGAALMLGGLDPGNAASRAATLAGLMFMTGICSVLIGGWASDRFGRTRTATLIFAVSGICSFMAGWLVGLPFTYLVVLGFLYGFFTAADSAIYSTAVTELAPRNLVGSAQALQSFIGFVAGTGAPVLAGFILDHAAVQSAWILVFSFNGVLALAGIACLLRLRRVQASRVAG